VWPYDWLMWYTRHSECIFPLPLILMQKEDENQPSSAKPVFDKDPEPVEWHLARNKEEFHILTVCMHGSPQCA